MTDQSDKKKMSRRELFTSLRPNGLGQWADRWRSGLADGLDGCLPDEKHDSAPNADAPPADLPGHSLEAISRGHPDEAIAALRTFVKRNPKDREARLLLGRVLYRDGAIVQSRVEFERIVRDSSADSQSRWPASCAVLFLACALARCGKLHKAASVLRNAEDVDRPQAADTLARLAEALDSFARRDDSEDASLDAAVDGLAATLENYIEAAYPSQMEMAADLAAAQPPGTSDNGGAKDAT
ncbi:MAG: tetratricopeptide repeat protein [Oceanidesulfovibrio sp.]